ncbi:hypothetical protein ACQWHJ_26865, partial [Salmonella enterica subsp. enterica serovar Infantis]
VFVRYFLVLLRSDEVDDFDFDVFFDLHVLRDCCVDFFVSVWCITLFLGLSHSMFQAEEVMEYYVKGDALLTV